MSEWVSSCCLTPTQHFFLALSYQEQLNFQRDDDEVRFVQDQHAYLGYYKASSLKQHIILIPSEPVFLLNAACLPEK